ncbi:MAG: hypothetical protein ACREJC_00765 [Tepidisphaeraceae bacterium]
MKIPWAVRHPGLAFNRATFCAFWGCTPERDGEKWTTENGKVTLLPNVQPWCGRCKGVLPVAEAR